MATYKNWLVQADGTPVLGAQACLYNVQGQRLDVDITEEEGLYYFLNVKTGHYQVRFFGKDLTEKDWLEIDVVDEIPTSSGVIYDPIIFATYPSIIVSEGDSKVTKQGELTTVLYTINNIITTQGKVASASIYTREDGILTWTLLENLSLDSGSTFTDELLTTITGISELELIEKPTLFHFKIEFFNQVGEIAVDNEVIVSPTTSLLFYGITDLEEFVGVTNLITKNTVQVPGKSYYTIPTDELICAWDDMKTSSQTNFYNALGQPVTLTAKQLKNITSYSIFMFISKLGYPPTYPWPYPSSDIYGDWYFINTVPINRTIVRIPKNKFIKVWIGFKTETTDDTTVLSKEETRY